LISDELSQTASRLEVGNICFVPAQIAIELPQIAFLLIGWSQSILPVSTGPAAAPEIALRSRFAFRRVFS
jgi:hypothetical protein